MSAENSERNQASPDVNPEFDLWTSSLSKADFIEDETDLPNRCRLINRDDQAAWVTCAVKGALKQTEGSREEGHGGSADRRH